MFEKIWILYAIQLEFPYSLLWIKSYLNILIFQGDTKVDTGLFGQTVTVYRASNYFDQEKAIINVEKKNVSLLCSKFRVFWSLSILDIGVKT